jgi:hypothetical protein
LWCEIALTGSILALRLWLCFSHWLLIDGIAADERTRLFPLLMPGIMCRTGLRLSSAQQLEEPKF